MVEAVDNAPSLARALARDDYDVAVVDVRLPPTHTTEGLEAAVAARAARPGLPGARAERSTWSRSTPASCSPPATARSATCSRTGWPTSTASSTPCARSPAGGTVLDPEVVAGLLSGARSRPSPG